MTNISVVEGDITHVSADALITTVNSGGLWFGAIDGAIRRTAGNTFHSQIMEYGPIRDGDAIYATAPTGLGCAFNAVIFIIDDLEQSVADVVMNGLALAVDNDLASVSIPTIRTGVMAGVRETHQEALDGLIKAISFYTDGTSLEQITIVVYNNPADVQYLTQALNTAKA